MISVCQTNKVQKYIVCGMLTPGIDKEPALLPVQQIAINQIGGETIECLCAMELLKRVNVENPVIVYVQHEGGQGLPEVIAIYNDDVDPMTFSELEHRISEIMGGNLDD